MDFLNSKRIEDLTDRQLMELILSNQVNIFQLLYRGNAYALDKFGGDLAEKGIHKDEAYLKLLDDAFHFVQQYKTLIDEDEI